LGGNVSGILLMIEEVGFSRLKSTSAYLINNTT